MELLDLHRSMASISQRLSIDELLKTNEESVKYGLLLSPQDASELIKSRNLVIHNYRRVELGIEVLKSIISEFCSSPFINAQDYVLTLSELVDIFYYMKNETDDRIGDNELIGLMKVFFNDSCRGSTELLKNRELELIASILKRSWDYTRGDD